VSVNGFAMVGSPVQDPATCQVLYDPTPRRSAGQGGAPAAALRARSTIRSSLGAAAPFVRSGSGIDEQLETEALRRYGLPETAPTMLCGTPAPVGERRIAGR
jgi:hypothetical protein